jgi:hypothetical protein
MNPALEKLIVGAITSLGPLAVAWIYSLVPAEYQGYIAQIIAGLGITGLTGLSVATTKTSTPSK